MIRPASLQPRPSQRRSRRPPAAVVSVLAALAYAGVLAGCSGAAPVVSGTSTTPAPSSSIAGPGSDSTATPTTSGVAGQAGVAGCMNLVATVAIKNAVTQAYRTEDPAMVHVLPKQGGFYYGTCSGTQYAATTFALQAGDTNQQDQVQMQDDGSTIKYFARPVTGSWRYTGSNTVPPAPPGCTATPFIPSPLLALWHNCPQPSPVELPVLGAGWGRGSRGFGQLDPSVVSDNGDPTGLVTAITWTSWTGPTAVGQGTSEYLGPHQSTYQGTEQRATIVAFDLGTCQGHPAYRAVEWYFPQHGQSFNPHHYLNACTGVWVGTS